MALSITRQTNLSVVNKLFALKRSSKSKSYTFTPINFRDMFSSSSTNQFLQPIVQKMQDAISGQPSIAGITTQLLTATGSTTARAARFGMQSESFEPSQQQIDSAINSMGSREQVSKWMVDGKTKVSIDGRKAVVTLDEKAAEADADLRACLRT